MKRVFENVIALVLLSVISVAAQQQQQAPSFDVLEKPVFGFGAGVVTNMNNVFAPDSSCLRIENFEISKGYALVKRKPFMRYNKASDSTSRFPIQALFKYSDSGSQKLLAIRDDPLATGYVGDSTLSLYEMQQMSGAAAGVNGAALQTGMQSVWPGFNALISSWGETFADGRLFIANHGFVPSFYSAGSSIIPMRMPSPGEPSVVPIGAGGTLNGRYIYAYCYVYVITGATATGAESNFSPRSEPVSPRNQEVLVHGLIAPYADDSVDINIYRSKAGRSDTLYFLATLAGDPGPVEYVDNLPDSLLGAPSNYPWGGGEYSTGEGMIDDPTTGTAISNTTYINAKNLNDKGAGVGPNSLVPLFPPGGPRVYQENPATGYIIRPPKRYLDWVAYSVAFVDSFGNYTVGPESFMYDTLGDNFINTAGDDDFDSLFTVSLYDIPVPAAPVKYRLLLRRHQVYGSRAYSDSGAVINFSDTNRFLLGTATVGGVGTDTGYGESIDKTFILDTLDLTSSYALTPYTDTVSIYELMTHDTLPRYSSSGVDGQYDSLVVISANDTALYYQGVVTTRLMPDSILASIPDSTIRFNPAAMTKFGQRLFAIGEASNPNRLYYSMASSPLAPQQLFKWPLTYFLDFEEGDGDRFVNMVSLENALLLFKNDKTIMFRGFRFADFAANTVFDKIGASAPRSVAKWNQEVSFAHYDGVYTITSGGSTRLLSAPIQDQIDSLGYDAMKRGVGMYVNGDYWLSLPANASDSYNSITWIWNREANAWYEYNFGFESGVEFNYLRDLLESPSSHYIFGGRDDKLYEYNYSDTAYYDNKSPDSAYTSLFQTKFFLEGQRGKKKIRYIDIEGGGGVDSLSITVLKDNGYVTFDTVGTYVLQTNFTANPTERLELDAIVKNVSFIVTDFADTASCIIKGLRIGYVPWSIDNE